MSGYLCLCFNQKRQLLRNATKTMELQAMSTETFHNYPERVL